MIIIDTHSHLYLEDFDADREAVIARAREAGLRLVLLPDIDSRTRRRLKDLADAYPGFFKPMAGLHPTSVKSDYRSELESVEQELEAGGQVAVGEIGIDLYWDKTYARQQEEALRKQFDLALKYQLPVVIHMRESFEAIMPVVDDYRDSGLTGVFHCFTGTEDQALQITGAGFLLGIGGVLTFKNSGLAGQIKNIDLQHIVVETDAPYLAPVPYRGKRNESSYITKTVEKLSEVYGMPATEIARITTDNAVKLFNLSL